MTTYCRRLARFSSRFRAMTRPLSGFSFNKKPSFRTPETLRRNRAIALLTALILLAGLGQCRAGELTISRDALQRTLKQQLFSASNGRYYLKGNPQSACFISAEDPKLSFEQDRIVVRMVTHARLGHQVAGACIGVNLAFPAQVSLAPDAEGETIGFRDARLDKVSDQKEINFVLSPFLRRQVPSGMKVNAAELIRGALAGSTVSSGYKVSLERLKIHSIVIQGDALVVDVDGDLSIK